MLVCLNGVVSPEEVEKIARMAAEKNKDQSGLSYYAYIWSNAIHYQPELMALLNKRQIVSWDDMLQGWRDRYKTVSHQPARLIIF
ncbi:cytoplasmic protein [Salmonella enterica subsp. enterica]|uniref:Cytoplasmic protein n=1 Tax=Salmonella enterica I TaxID=59201 RepID=A0A447U1E3_SALET|nr:cytoplasmic protein [Salmonella enterica subsp. enterica]